MLFSGTAPVMMSGKGPSSEPPSDLGTPSWYALDRSLHAWDAAELFPQTGVRQEQALSYSSPGHGIDMLQCTENVHHIEVSNVRNQAEWLASQPERV